TCCTTRALCSSRASCSSVRERSSRRCHTTCRCAVTARAQSVSQVNQWTRLTTAKWSAPFRSRIDQAIAHARLRDESGVGGVVVELLAQLAGVDAQILALAAVLGAPHLLQDGAVSEKASRPTGEESEKGKVLGRQGDVAAGADHRLPAELDLDVSGPQGLDGVGGT